MERFAPLSRDLLLEDVEQMLDAGNFEDGLLIVRLFRGLSKDQFTAALIDALGPGGMGVKRYKSHRANYVSALVQLGLLDPKNLPDYALRTMMRMLAATYALSVISTPILLMGESVGPIT